jgi:hypothetical protein
MVKRGGKCVSALALTASGLVMRPAQPVAGQQFAVGATIVNRKTKKGLPSAAVSCPAVVGDELVVARRRFFDTRHSAAYCYWMLPASARGGVLKAAVVAAYQGAQARRWLKLRVR